VMLLLPTRQTKTICAVIFQADGWQPLGMFIGFLNEGEIRLSLLSASTTEMPMWSTMAICGFVRWNLTMDYASNPLGKQLMIVLDEGGHNSLLDIRKR